MKLRIIITPRKAVRHPESECIRDTLQKMGFKGVSALTIGRMIEIEVDDPGLQKALEEYTHTFLANPIVEDYRVEVVS